MSMQLSPIPGYESTQPFAECRNLDLSQPIDAPLRDELKAALLKHGLIVFRDQTLTPQQEVEFNRLFAWHDPNQSEFIFGFGAPSKTHRIGTGAQLPNCPEVSVLGNVVLKNYHGIEQIEIKPQLALSFSGWHADGVHDMFDGLPEMTTMYSPTGWTVVKGGETFFTSGVRAVQRLSTSLYDELSRCVVAYMRSPNDVAPDPSRRVSPGPAAMADGGIRRTGFVRSMDNPEPLDFELSLEHADNGGRHRCIRRHPLTGEDSLYVTPGQAVCLLDAETGEIRHDVEETQDLLADALRDSTAPGVRYEHTWREGDFVAWLNTLVLHSASDPSHIEGQRVVHRVRLSTPKTRWANGKYLSF